MSTARPPEGDIAPLHWQGGAIDCASCSFAALRERPGRLGCEPGHARMQDAYARRVDRFFRWHTELSDGQLEHPCFEVRAIAARHCTVFRLSGLLGDPDETVRLQVALRLPQAQRGRLVNDPHREVRIRVVQRLEPAALAALRCDPDYGVRWEVAQRADAATLLALRDDEEAEVRDSVLARLGDAPLRPLSGERHG